ncbi:MAG: phospho-sugar mutase [Actinomycetota bacterium]|nr:phospho-sugar mutase [Actinomycetota bacterium]
MTHDLGRTLGAAQDWLDNDPDPQTQAELATLIATAQAGSHQALAALDNAFATRLSFGTAGIRGALGPGPNRMNRVVVRQTAAGLARYLRAHGGGSVVIGHDARHRSADFAHDLASVLTQSGLSVMVLPRALPTPVLAFAIRWLGCAAGVMVTASHNPPRDNGIKVYLGDGSQIVAPVDAEISAEIDREVELRHLAQDDPDAEWLTLDEQVVEAYIDTATALVADSHHRNVRAVYTAMHGVGGVLLERVFARAGFPPVIPVPEQFQPDADFPTVAFPNPEEPGAMDLALALAREQAVDLIIASDPDADRCAIGIPDTGDSAWRMLSGDEVGWLLGWWMLQRGARGTLAQSLVSGSMLEAIAKSAGVDYDQTLTGFKWISRVPNLAYGYEEALGYCVDPANVRDKDGITAALLFAEMAASIKAKGQTIQGLLDQLALEHGVYATSQVSVRVNDPAQITKSMQALRSNPPTSIGGFTVIGVDDLELPTDGLPPTDGLRFNLDDGGRVIVRPSGTEPKVKCYLQVVERVQGGDVRAAREAAGAALSRIAADARTWLG